MNPVTVCVTGHGTLPAARRGPRPPFPGGAGAVGARCVRAASPGGCGQRRAESRGRGLSGASLLFSAVRAVEAAAVGFYSGSAFMARSGFLLFIMDVFLSNV